MKRPAQIAVFIIIAALVIFGAVAVVSCTDDGKDNGDQTIEQTNVQSTETTNEEQIQKDIEDVESPVAPIEGD